MRSTIKLIFVAAAVVLVACQKEEASTPSNFPKDGVIRVATNVEPPTTRGGVTTENLRTFSINIENTANATYSYFAFFEKADGVWSSYADAEKKTLLTMLWQNSTQPVTVTAVSFFKQEFTEVTMAVEPIQSNEKYLKSSDILYMAPTVIVPATDLTMDGKLPVTFKHLLSKVNLSITLGTKLNTATNPISNLKISGTKRYFIWTPLDNSALEVTGTQTTIIPLAGAYTAGSGSTTNAVASYEVILVPQTVAAKGFLVTFTIDGKPYTWISDAAVTLEQGKLYTLAITAGGNIVTASKMMVSEWTTGLEAK